MKRALPSWMFLVVGAIVVVAAMFWVRANPPQPSAEEDPLGSSCDAISRHFGMEIEPVSSEEYGGLRVTSVDEGDSAAQAGIEVGDYIMACGERSVWNSIELVEYITEVSSRYNGFTLMIKRGEEYLIVGFGLTSSQPGGHDHGGGHA